MRSRRRSQSLVTLLRILCGFTAATSGAHADDALSYGEFGEWVVPPEEANDGPNARLRYGKCELPGTLGQNIHVQVGTHGHLPTRSALPDDAWASLEGPVNPLGNSIARAQPEVSFEAVCGASATTDLEFFRSEWQSIGVQDSRPYFECPPEQPYLLAARCQARTRDPNATQPPKAAMPGAIASVVANGSGCPEGTWSADISTDGLEASLTFTTYDGVVYASEPNLNSHCLIAIRPANMESVTYAIESVVFDGEAMIEPGMTARLVATSFPQGFPERGVTGTSEFDVPFDGTFSSILVFGAPPYDALDWSECGSAYDLNVSTRILMSSEPHASGTSYVNLSAAGPGSTARVAVRLVSRACKRR